MELPILRPKKVALDELRVRETITGRDEKKTGQGLFSTADTSVKYKCFGVENAWYQYSKRGAQPVTTIAPWDMTGNRSALFRLEDFLTELDDKGVLSAFDQSEILKLSHLSRFPQFPFVSDKGFGVGLSNSFPDELINVFKKHFSSRARAIKPSLKKLSIVRRSNTGWPFLLNGNSKANEMNNLLNVLLTRTELSAMQVESFLSQFTSIPACSVMFTRTSHGSHKAVRDFSRLDKGDFVSTIGSKGYYPRIRGVYANYGFANLSGRPLMSKVKDVVTSIAGLKHSHTSITESQVRAALSSGFIAKAEDISGFDLSVSDKMLEQIYDIYEDAFPEERNYISFARRNFYQPVASPGFSKGVINAYERSGIVSSGDIMTSMNGCIINLLRMIFSLTANGEFKNYEVAVSSILNGRHPFLIWGDDTVLFTKKPIDTDRWKEINGEIGFKTDLEPEVLFLMKRYNRGSLPAHTPISRLIMQTIGREHAYVGPYSAMIGLYHRSETAVHAPGFESTFHFLMTNYFPELRIYSYNDLKVEVNSTKFKYAAQAELSSGPGVGWLKEFVRGITRGSFDMADFTGDSELLRFLGLQGVDDINQSFDYKPQGALNSVPVLKLYQDFARSLDDYTGDVHSSLQKRALSLLGI